VLETADRLGAPIVKSLSGKHSVPDDSPFTTGGLGLLGTAPSEEVMESCDTLLMLGTNFPYLKYLPIDREIHCVQIDVDSTRVGTRLPTDAPIVGDVAETLRMLLPELKVKDDRSFLDSAQKSMATWREDMEALEDPDRAPIAPQYLMHVVDEAARDDAILTCDSGTIATWAARHWKIREQREFYLSGNLATMAPGLPYAIAMQKAFPSRQVIAFVGDGGFAMLMAEFLTAVRYGLPIKVVVNNNNSYGQILWEQIVLGFPEFAVRHREPEADFAAWARACGADGVTVTRSRDLEGAVETAVRNGRPCVIDVHVDAEVRPPATGTWQLPPIPYKEPVFGAPYRPS
jgi:pyruvate dehydrogenase (quinone)